MRSSSGGMWVTGSESPVPRLSQTTRRVLRARCATKGANGVVGSS